MNMYCQVEMIATFKIQYDAIFAGISIGMRSKNQKISSQYCNVIVSMGSSGD